MTLSSGLFRLVFVRHFSHCLNFLNLDCIFRYGWSARSALTTAAIRMRSRLYVLFLLDCSTTLPYGSSLCIVIRIVRILRVDNISIRRLFWLIALYANRFNSVAFALICRCFLNMRLPRSCFDEFILSCGRRPERFSRFIPRFAICLYSQIVIDGALCMVWYDHHVRGSKCDIAYVRSIHSAFRLGESSVVGAPPLHIFYRQSACALRMPSVLVIVRIIVRNALLSVSVLSKTLRRNTHTIKMCLLNREFLFGLYAH